MRGRGHKRLAQRSVQQWRRLPFDALCDRHLPTPLHGTLRLPVRCASAASAPAAMDVHLSTNSDAVLQWWRREYAPLLRTRDDEAAAAGPTTQVLASVRVGVHAGPPAPPLGYPEYISLEGQQYTDGVLRGEAYAYEHTEVAGAVPAPPRGAQYLSPVRWMQQPLLDGVVAQRLTAHTGVTTGALLDTRRTAIALGRQLPPVALSPFYAVGDLLDRWYLFGEAAAVLPPTPTQQQQQQRHHHRIAELALGAALLSNYRATWLNGAVLSHTGTGRTVLVVGPQRSGKTTLALHCLAAATPACGGGGEVRVTAAEHCLLAAGSPVQRMLDPASVPSTSPTILACSLPHPIDVGLGAVLGTLRPNPALAAAAELPPPLQSEAGLRAFLRNSDGVLWDMHKTLTVRLQDISAAPSPWEPAVVGPLAGVVLLDWDVGELARTSPVAVRNAVRQTPLHDGGVTELMTRARDYMFHGHHLLRSIYDAPRDAPARLADALADETRTTASHRPANAAAAPALHCIEGSVNFDLATQLVTRLLTTGV